MHLPAKPINYANAKAATRPSRPKTPETPRAAAPLPCCGLPPELPLVLPGPELEPEPLLLPLPLLLLLPELEPPLGTIVWALAAAAL
jgi:hypothetical protein